MPLSRTASSHMLNMTHNFSKTSMPWGPRRSILAGGSGIFFFLPGVFATGAMKGWIYLAFWIQGVVSFMSDYWTCGMDSAWHGADRWMATIMTLGMMWFAHDRLSFWHAALALPPLFCLYLSKRAVLAADWGKFVLWHTLWHVGGVSGASYIMWLMYDQPALGDVVGNIASVVVDVVGAVGENASAAMTWAGGGSEL